MLQCLERNFFIDCLRTTCVDEHTKFSYILSIAILYVQHPRIVSEHAMALNLNWPIYYYYYIIFIMMNGVLCNGTNGMHASLIL